MSTVSRFNKECGTWDIDSEGLPESNYPRPNDVKVRDILVDTLEEVVSKGVGITEIRVSRASGPLSIVLVMDEGNDVMISIKELRDIYAESQMDRLNRGEICIR